MIGFFVFFAIVDGQVDKIDQRGILIEASSTGTAVAENIAHRHSGSLVPLDLFTCVPLVLHHSHNALLPKYMGFVIDKVNQREMEQA